MTHIKRMFFGSAIVGALVGLGLVARNYPEVGGMIVLAIIAYGVGALFVSEFLEAQQ